MDLQREIKNYLKHNLTIEIREEDLRTDTGKEVFVELFIEGERISYDSIFVMED